MAKTSDIDAAHLAHHLRSAAKLYEDYAKDLRLPPSAKSAGNNSLAATFERQAAEARAYASVFEECSSIRVW